MNRLKQGIITDYDDFCIVCGKPKECHHHLIPGTGRRNLCESDGLKVPMCNRCHNMGPLKDQIHGSALTEKLSKIIGQLAWEKHEIALNGTSEDEARKKFRERYGKSYL